MTCSIARTLDIAGEPWTPLVLRDVWVGINRFDQIRDDLGISTKVLAERLAWLVEQNVLSRRLYSERPPRSEYVLTAKGLELCDVLLVISAWGDRWTAGGAGPPVLLRHRTCGAVTRAELRCASCGQPISAGDVDHEPGPGARIAAPAG
jgi:DNA-binding HxlR family transcriptional regulator